MLYGITDFCLEVSGKLSKQAPEVAPMGKKKAPKVQPEPSAHRAKASNGQPKKGKEKEQQRAKTTTPGPSRVSKTDHQGKSILGGSIQARLIDFYSQPI